MAAREARDVRARAFDASAKRGGLFGQLAFFGGAVAMTGLGVALAVDPTMHPHLELAGEYVDRAGVDLGTLMLGGLALGVAGLLWRGIARMGMRPMAGSESPTLRAVGELRVALDNQNGAVQSVQAELESMRQDVASLRQHAEESSRDASAPNGEDSMFRLAASLDQLGASLDQRMYSGTQQVLEAVQAALDDARTARDVERQSAASSTEEVVRELQRMSAEMARLTDDLAELRAAASAPAPPPAPYGEVADPSAPHGAAAPLQHAPTEYADELEVEVDLDADVAPEPSHVTAPTAAERPDGLDLLEHLDTHDGGPDDPLAEEQAPPLFPDMGGGAPAAEPAQPGGASAHEAPAPLPAPPPGTDEHRGEVELEYDERLAMPPDGPATPPPGYGA